MLHRYNVHQLIGCTERAFGTKEYTLSTFLDIKRTYDYTAFESIETSMEKGRIEVWTPRHSGITGNEIAYKIAKGGISLTRYVPETRDVN